MIDVLRSGGVLRLTINRVEKRNALDLAHYQELTNQLTLADQGEQIRVVWLEGAGGNFTAGNDLGDFLKNPPTGADSPVVRFMRALMTLKKPLVVMIEGAAVGIGCSMLLHADMVFAADSARFQMPFVNLGLVPEFGLTYLLPRMLGPLKAKELLLLGGPFSAVEAQSFGLVNHVFPVDDLSVQTEKAVKALEKQPAEAMQITKQLLRLPQEEAIEQAILAEMEVFEERLRSPEALNALQGFFNQK